MLKPPGYSRHIRLSLGQCGVGFQTRDDVYEMSISFMTPIVIWKLGEETHRHSTVISTQHPQIGLNWKLKTRFHHADDGVCQVINSYCLPNDLFIASKPPEPQSVAD